MVQRFFNLSGYTPTPRDQIPEERNRAVSAPVRGRTAPRFRPPKSVYGPIDQHPFAKAPVAKIHSSTPSAIPKPRKRLQKEQRVRFTPSATARDSEVNILQAAIESTTATALNPFQPAPSQSLMPAVQPPPKKICHHRRTSGSTMSAEKPKVTTTVEYSTRRSPLPYHRGDLPSWSPAESSIRPASPSTPTQAERDSLCVLDSNRDRPLSVTSTTFLMSGGLRAPSPPPHVPAPKIPELKKEKWCWKCAVQIVFDKLDDWWMKSAGCVCFVCCGFDIDDEGNVSTSTIHSYNATLRGGYGDAMSGPRMVVLNQTPAVIL